MAFKKFNLAALSEMDNGLIRAAFEQLIDRARHDCWDRPAVTAPRTVALKVSLQPVASDSGDLASVVVKIELQDKLPKRGGKAYNMRAEPGGLIFSEFAPEDARQMTLDMAGKPKPVEPTTDPEKETKTDVG